MTRTPPSVVTPEQAQALIRAADARTLTGLRNRAILSVLYYCGLRVSEAVKLRRSQLVEGRLEIRQSKRGRGRNVPVPGPALDAVSAWLDAAPDSAYIFCQCYDRRGLCESRVGGPLTTRYVQQLVGRVASRIGVACTPHTLRHSYATHLHSAGVPIRDVQHLLGHASLQTTMVYTHVDVSELGARVSSALVGD